MLGSFDMDMAGVLGTQLESRSSCVGAVGPRLTSASWASELPLRTHLPDDTISISWIRLFEAFLDQWLLLRHVIALATLQRIWSPNCLPLNFWEDFGMACLDFNGAPGECHWGGWCERKCHQQFVSFQCPPQWKMRIDVSGELSDEPQDGAVIEGPFSALCASIRPGEEEREAGDGEVPLLVIVHPCFNNFWGGDPGVGTECPTIVHLGRVWIPCWGGGWTGRHFQQTPFNPFHRGFSQAWWWCHERRKGREGKQKHVRPALTCLHFSRVVEGSNHDDHHHRHHDHDHDDPQSPRRRVQWSVELHLGNWHDLKLDGRLDNLVRTNFPLKISL